MAIGSVIRKDWGLFIYDENGQQTGVIQDPASQLQLQGYTSSIVTTTSNNGLTRSTYDDHGNQLTSSTG